MKGIALIWLGLLFAPELSTYAQGSVHLSNLGQPSVGAEAISSDFLFGMLFRVRGNPNGYELNSIQMLMNPASGNPNGFTASIYSFNDATGQPGSSLGVLTGTDPAAGGLFTYTASNIPLSTDAAYVVVLTASTPASEGTYQWSIAGASGYVSADGWFLSGGRYGSSDGLTWGIDRNAPFQMSVYATPIPEPFSGLLLLIGVGFISRRLKKISKRP